jgi:uncharacterized RDD family membrane protein YckC
MPAAPLTIRFAAYIIDSVVLFGFILGFLIVAGAVLLFSSDLGQEDPPDSAYHAFMAVFIGGSAIGWSVFNLALLRARGQTVGQYITGTRVEREDGRGLTAGIITLRWLVLHPSLFHPLLIPVWTLFALLTVSLTLSQVVLALTLGLIILCVIAPLVAAVSVLFDRDHRALYDRIAGTAVVRLSKGRVTE